VIVVRLFLFLVLTVIAASLLIALVKRDVRYLRFAWQVFKFSVVLLLVVAALLMLGRLVLYGV
jgi:hypothetical protein